jgi:hypothetical protein
MTDDLIIKAFAKKSYFLVLIVGGLGACALAYHLYNLYNSSYTPYPQIGEIALITCLGTFGIYALYSILSEFSLEIYKDRLEVKTILGFTKRTILLNDILYWTEIDKHTRYVRYTDLAIYTERSKFTISSTIYNDYESIKIELTRRKKRDVAKEAILVERSQSMGAIGICVGMSLFFFGCSYNTYSKLDTKIYDFQSTKIEQQIITKTELNKDKHNYLTSIDISIQQYPNFQFRLDHKGFSAVEFKKLCANLQTRSVIALEINNEIYHKKLLKDQELTFWEKTINYNSIPICGISDKYNTYLTSKEYRQYKLDNREKPIYVWIYAIFGVALIGLVISVIVSMPKSK